MDILHALFDSCLARCLIETECTGKATIAGYSAGANHESYLSLSTTMSQNERSAFLQSRVLNSAIILALKLFKPFSIDRLLNLNSYTIVLRSILHPPFASSRIPRPTCVSSAEEGNMHIGMCLTYANAPPRLEIPQPTNQLTRSVTVEISKYLQPPQ